MVANRSHQRARSLLRVSLVSGSQITAERTTDGRAIIRDASHFKCINDVMLSEEWQAPHERPEEAWEMTDEVS